MLRRIHSLFTTLGVGFGICLIYLSMQANPLARGSFLEEAPALSTSGTKKPVSGNADFEALIDRFVRSVRQGEDKFMNIDDPDLRPFVSKYPQLRDHFEERGISVRDAVRVVYRDPQNRGVIDRLLESKPRQSCSGVK